MARTVRTKAAGTEQAFHALRAAEAERDDVDKRINSARTAYHADGMKRVIDAANRVRYFEASPARQMSLLATFEASAVGLAASENDGKQECNESRRIHVAANVAHHVGDEKKAVIRDAGLKWHGRAQAWVGWVREEVYEMLRAKFGSDNIKIRADKPPKVSKVNTGDSIAPQNSATSSAKAEFSNGDSDPPSDVPPGEGVAGAEESGAVPGIRMRRTFGVPPVGSQNESGPPVDAANE